ncbi:MAG: thioredoxin fold domain-containing protein [Pseudobdellovibrio sp.]
MRLFATIILLSQAVFAGLTDNQAEIKSEKTKINITPKAGFHLNAEAPASAVIDNLESLNKPSTKTEKLFVFAKPEKATKAVLSFYVCDDKKTVCEKHTENLNFKTGEVKKETPHTTFNSASEVHLASTNGKPTLLVFSAPWCPACIRMMTETYPVASVKKELAKVNFLKLNSDLPENSELSEKFGIKAIPTLILLDAKGNESFRWIDYQQAGEFTKSLKTALHNVNKAEENLAKAKLGDPKAASELAHRSFNALDYAEAYKWFSFTKDAEDQKYKLASEVGASQDKSEDDDKAMKDYLATLEKATTMTTSQLDRIRWTLDYLDKKNDLKTFGTEATEKAKKLIPEIDALIDNPKAADKAFAESTYGDYTGFEKDELLWMKAKLAKLVQDPKLEEATKKISIDTALAKKLSVDRPGQMLMDIAYLKEAGDTTHAEEMYKKLVAKYPTSYVYFEKYARFAQKNKNLDQALQLTNEALKFPEGNYPQLALLKSQILVDLKKNDEAAGTIDETLKTAGIDNKRYAKTVKKLNELKGQIAESLKK